MSLTKAQFKETAKSIGAVLLATTFMVANANAADQAKFVQVADLDLTKPIPSNICVKDDAQGKAIEKMRTIMGARQQKSIVVGNQYVANTEPAQGGVIEKMFTSNLQQGGEGYNVLSSRPMGAIGTEYCFTQNQKVYIYSVFNSAGVPALVNKGELGIALSNNDKVGLKVAIAALTDKGTISVVNFDPTTGRGSQKTSNGGGNMAADVAVMGNVAYSASLPLSAKKALGIPMDDAVASVGTGSPTLFAAAKPAPQ